MSKQPPKGLIARILEASCDKEPAPPCACMSTSDAVGGTSDE